MAVELELLEVLEELVLSKQDQQKATILSASPAKVLALVLVGHLLLVVSVVEPLLEQVAQLLVLVVQHLEQAVQHSEQLLLLELLEAMLMPILNLI